MAAAQHVLRKYDIQQKLGKGAYAVVFKGVDKKSKNVIAMKKIFDAFQNATDAQRTFREIEFLKQMGGHEHIAALLEGVMLARQAAAGGAKAELR